MFPDPRGPSLLHGFLASVVTPDQGPTYAVAVAETTAVQNDPVAQEAAAMARELMADRIVGIDAAIWPSLTKVVVRVAAIPDLAERSAVLADLLLALMHIAVVAANIPGDSADHSGAGEEKLRSLLAYLEESGTTF